MDHDTSTRQAGLPALEPGTPMLIAYVPRGSPLERQTVEESDAIPDNAVWFELVTPSVTEDKLLEGTLGIAIPTR